MTDNFFGFLEVDIEVPEYKWNYFSEMCPIFQKDLLEKLDRKPSKSRKLLATLKGEKILIKSTRLKWLIEHGCVVTKSLGIIRWYPH